MSGGGTKLLKGRMGSRIVADVSPAQLEAMEKSLENETKAAAVLLPDYYKSVSTHVAGIYANVLEQKKSFA